MITEDSNFKRECSSVLGSREFVVVMGLGFGLGVSKSG
jgi:hypothetical protein